MRGKGLKAYSSLTVAFRVPSENAHSFSTVAKL